MSVRVAGRSSSREQGYDRGGRLSVRVAGRRQGGWLNRMLFLLQKDV